MTEKPLITGLCNRRSTGKEQQEKEVQEQQEKKLLSK